MDGDKMPMVIALLLLATFVSGIWLHRHGRPRNTAVLTFHKLASLAAVVLIAMAARQLWSTGAIGTAQAGAVLVTSALFLGAIASGGWLAGRRGAFYGITAQYRKDPRPFHGDLQELFSLLLAGQIKPRIAVRLPLLDARRANEMLEVGGQEGKQVVVSFRRLAREDVQAKPSEPGSHLQNAVGPSPHLPVFRHQTPDSFGQQACRMQLLLLPIIVR